jgi:hypothetical protein
VFVHPGELPAPRVDGMPPFAADFLLDTTRAAYRLVRNGVVRRYPSVEIILSHAGGFVPYASHRLAIAITGDTQRPPSEVLEDFASFYFDTALSGSPAALPSLLAFAKPGHVLFGSDWPYAPPIAVGYLHGAARRLRRARRRRPRGDRSRAMPSACFRDSRAWSGMNRIDVPVLIVGGGRCGLTSSMLLSQLGVETLLVSALPTTSVLPKAHVLNQRAMEILTDVGVGGRDLPPRHAARTDAATARTMPGSPGRTRSTAGSSAHGVVGRGRPRPRLGGGERVPADEPAADPTRADPEGARRSAGPRSRSVQYGARRRRAGPRRRHGDGSGQGDRTDTLVRARYVLACDGGRTVGRRLGVEMQGARDVMRIVSIYMSADLSRWARIPTCSSAGSGSRSVERSRRSSRWGRTTGDRIPRSGSST